MSAKIDNPRRSLFPWALIGGCLAAWAGALVFWLQVRPVFQLRQQLMDVVPIFFWLIFAALIILLAWNYAAIKALYLRCPRGHRIALLGIVLFAWACVQGVSPRTHRIFYDEDIYEDIGLSMAQTGKAAMTHDGRWKFGRFQSFRQEYNKQPNGWPFLLSLAYRVFGPSEAISFHLNYALFAASVCLVFFCGSLLFESSLAGLFAGLVYALIPENVLWFSTVAVEPSSAWACLLAMAVTLLFFQNRSKAALFLAAVAWSLAVQFRPEILLLTGVAALMFYIDSWEEFSRPALYGALVVFLLLISAHLVHLYVMRGESWGSSGDKLSLSYLAHNLKTNSIYYWNAKRFPVFFSVFAVIGLAWPGTLKSRLYTGLWFLCSWGIFIFFYAGSYEYGADVRFSLLSMAPLALLTGRGLERAIDWLNRRWRIPWMAPAMLALGMQFLLYAPLMHAVGEEAWPSRSDHAAAEEFARLIPEDGIVLTHNPNMFHMWGKNAAQASLVKEQSDYVAQAMRPVFKENMFFHWNYWCEVPVPVQRSFCEVVLQSFSSELIQERRVKGQRYALYRLKESSGGSSASPKSSARQSMPQ